MKFHKKTKIEILKGIISDLFDFFGALLVFLGFVYLMCLAG